MNKKAFSFVEIMIAVTVMVLGILPVYYLLTSGTRGIRLGLYEIQAVNHASSVMELLRGMPYHKIMHEIYPADMPDFAEVSQSGWQVYSRTEQQMVDVDTENGIWQSVTGADSRMVSYFNSSAMSAQNGILPPLEAYFDRNIRLNCNERYCIAKVMVSWKEESSGSSSSRRSVDLRTAVVGTH